MATLADRIPKLQNGDHLSRDEFERRYAAMPNGRKAELIEGVVYMPSPVSTEHSRPHFGLITWMGIYMAATDGIDAGDNGTLRLDLDNEPQPDAYLRISESHGGQSHIDIDKYVSGAPEMVAEIAASTVSIDLNSKLRVYRRNEVQEYLVWRVDDGEVDWFALRGTDYARLSKSAGIYKSKVLPGLWLDAEALVSGDLATVLDVGREGIASPEHGTFVKKLQQKAKQLKRRDSSV